VVEHDSTAGAKHVSKKGAKASSEQKAAQNPDTDRVFTFTETTCVLPYLMEAVPDSAVSHAKNDGAAQDEHQAVDLRGVAKVLDAERFRQYIEDDTAYPTATLEPHWIAKVQFSHSVIQKCAPNSGTQRAGEFAACDIDAPHACRRVICVVDLLRGLLLGAELTVAASPTETLVQRIKQEKAEVKQIRCVRRGQPASYLWELQMFQRQRVPNHETSLAKLARDSKRKVVISVPDELIGKFQGEINALGWNIPSKSIELKLGESPKEITSDVLYRTSLNDRMKLWLDDVRWPLEDEYTKRLREASVGAFTANKTLGSGPIYLLQLMRVVRQDKADLMIPARRSTLKPQKQALSQTSDGTPCDFWLSLFWCCRRVKRKAILDDRSPPLNVAAVGKILVSHFQYIFLIGALALKWPEAFKYLTRAFELASGPGYAITSASCVNTFDALERAEVMLFALLVLTSPLLVRLVAIFIEWLRKACIGPTEDEDSASNPAERNRPSSIAERLRSYVKLCIIKEDVSPVWYALLVRMPVVFTYFVHPFITVEMLQMFSCDRLGDAELMTVDYTISCRTERYRRWRTFSVIFLFFWCAFLPVCALYLLWLGKEEQSGLHAQRKRQEKDGQSSANQEHTAIKKAVDGKGDGHIEAAQDAKNADLDADSKEQFYGLVHSQSEDVQDAKNADEKKDSPALNRQPSSGADVFDEADKEASQDSITEHIADYNNPLYFLRQGYNNKNWWWEVVLFVRKLSYSLLIVFMRDYPLAQTVWASFITFAALYMQMWRKPHIEKQAAVAAAGHGRVSGAETRRIRLEQRPARVLRALEMTSLLLCGFTITASFFYFEPSVVHTSREVAVTVLIVGSNACFFLFAILYAVNQMRWSLMWLQLKRVCSRCCAESGIRAFCWNDSAAWCAKVCKKSKAGQGARPPQNSKRVENDADQPDPSHSASGSTELLVKS